MQPLLFKLPNGLRVILIDTKAFPTMTTILLFATGSRYESESNSGIAHFLEHMVFKGSKKYPDFFTVSSVLESLGATHNAFTSKDHTGFWVKSPTVHFEKVIDVMSDIIIQPLLPAGEIEREKGVIVAEMDMYEDNPMRRVGEYFEQLLYPRSTLGMDVIGRKETVTKFQRQDFVEYMRQFYQPKNAVLVVAGGLNLRSQENLLESELASRRTSRPVTRRLSSESEGSLRPSLAQTSTSRANFLSNLANNNYLKIIEEKFTKFEAGNPEGSQARILQVFEKQKKPETLIHYKKTEQTHLSLGFRTFSFKDRRRYALAVLGTMLGGGSSSRLFIEVRERRGLCYYIYTGREHYHDVGYIVTQAGVANNLETVKKAIDTILEEHKKIIRGQIKGDELTRAKEIIKGRMMLSLEDSANVASWYGTKQILEGSIETVDQVIGKIEKVRQEEVVELAKEIFRPERLNLALIGPYDKINLKFEI